MRFTFTSKDGKLYIDGMEVLKGWESYTGWYWFATAKVQERRVGEGDGGSMMADGKEVNDTIWFGLVQGHEEEWGSFSQAELESMPGQVWEIKPQDMPHAGRRS